MSDFSFSPEEIEVCLIAGKTTVLSSQRRVTQKQAHYRPGNFGGLPRVTFIIRDNRSDRYDGTSKFLTLLLSCITYMSSFRIALIPVKDGEKMCGVTYSSPVDPV